MALESETLKQQFTPLQNSGRNCVIIMAHGADIDRYEIVVATIFMRPLHRTLTQDAWYIAEGWAEVACYRDKMIAHRNHTPT